MAIAIRTTTEPARGNDDAQDRESEEVVRLELLRRLSLGAAHSLNNAFTGILGETLCLLEDRKDDPAVVEACTLIQNEVERCARLTRLVAMRAQSREHLIDEADLGSLLRGVEALLHETVSRSLSICCEVPAPGVCVRGSNEDCELLLLSITHGLVRDHVGGGNLTIDVEPADRTIDVVVALRSDRSDRPARERGDPGWERRVSAALDAIATRIGARVVAGDTNVVRLRLARSREA